MAEADAFGFVDPQNVSRYTPMGLHSLGMPEMPLIGSNTTLTGNPEPSISSPISGDIGQAGNTEELNGSVPNTAAIDVNRDHSDLDSESGWADSDCEGGDTSGASEEEGEELDEELELEQIAMEDGLHDGFDSNTLGDFKF
ncbi:hypothetical protein BDN67DRAFT_986138 [Paxillus ammoniavirescens]|nr:hypothetical protein BDN67DRAFT_986138 [Paxillus ammoniavirescens]